MTTCKLKVKLKNKNIGNESNIYLKFLNKMGKSYKKSAYSAKNKNESLNKFVLSEEDALFGRALKKLGNGRFRIQVPNADGHGVEADAAIAGKTVVRINIGDVVIVGRNDTGKHVTYEILGSCDSKVVQTLRKAQRLHPSLFHEDDELGDDIFDRSEDVKEEETATAKKDKSNKPVKKDKILETKAQEENDDVDVDRI